MHSWDLLHNGTEYMIEDIIPVIKLNGLKHILIMVCSMAYYTWFIWSYHTLKGMNREENCSGKCHTSI